MTTTDPAPVPVPGRRKAILGLAGLAAGGAAAVVAGAPPAGAAGHGQALTLGDPGNTASATTGVTMDSPSAPAFQATNSSLGPGIVGIRDEPSGLPVNSAGVVGDAFNGHGVEGLSHWQTAVVGKSVRHNGVWGKSDQASGVLGESAGSYGVFGRSGAVGTGVAGWVEHDYPDGAGVAAYNPKGIGLLGVAKIQARLRPADVPGPPTRVTVSPGSLHVDSLGVLRYAPVAGAWKTVATPTSAGAFHVLPAPVRVYDSRPGTQPDVGPKTRLPANQARTIDLTANASGVPAGASAALLMVLVDGAPAFTGNLTVWAAGVAKPQAVSMGWGAGAGRVSTQVTTAVDATGKVQVAASRTVDVVIDVVGWYG